MFNVKFVIVCVILEANGKTSGFPETATLLLPSALLEGVAWDHSRWNKTEMTVGVARLSQQLESSSFQFMSAFDI